MSYTKSNEPQLIPIVTPVQISGNVTLEGPIMPYRGEVTGAILVVKDNHIADDADNNFLVQVAVNANVAVSINTGITDANANSVAFPTLTTANARFLAGEQLTVIFTEENTGLNFSAGDAVHVQVIPVYDHAVSG